MIEFQRVSFTYPQKTEAVFRDLNLHFHEGETVLVSGVSGSGKSTLLRLINGLVPHFSGGTLRGKILVNGMNPVEVGPAVMSHQVGFVFQDPEISFVMDNVEDELAFGLENAAIPGSIMKERIVDTLAALEIEHLRRRRIESLSGGEKQKVAIAAALVLGPPILVLDEPTSQLDVQSAEDVFQILQRLKRAFGLTIILAEHRFERVLTFCDQMVMLGGEQHYCLSGKPEEVLAQTNLAPPMLQLAKQIGYQPLPTQENENRALADYLIAHYPKLRHLLPTKLTLSKGGKVPHLQIEGLSVRYGDANALDGIDLTVYRGECLALIGRNGAGKTTLLRAIMGLITPSQGVIRLNGKDIQQTSVWQRSLSIAYLPQDPNALLFADTVLDELQTTLKNFQLHLAVEEQMKLLEKLGIARYAQDYPRDLSVGERQRVALAAILIVKPAMLLLDEPTRGLDYHAKQALIRMLEEMRKEGMTIFVVTHDVEFLVQFTERVVWIEKGKVIADGAPAAVLGSAGIYTPQLLHYFPNQGFLTVNEVLCCLTEKDEMSQT
ncbi:MAG: ABC transporter ATP-binding protein [Anaerolineales bacterium]